MCDSWQSEDEHSSIHDPGRRSTGIGAACGGRTGNPPAACSPCRGTRGGAALKLCERSAQAFPRYAGLHLRAEQRHCRPAKNRAKAGTTSPSARQGGSVRSRTGLQRRRPSTAIVGGCHALRISLPDVRRRVSCPCCQRRRIRISELRGAGNCAGHAGGALAQVTSRLCRVLGRATCAVVCG